jgi:hypothetical protein
MSRLAIKTNIAWADQEDSLRKALVSNNQRLGSRLNPMRRCKNDSKIDA